ncbi:MAG: response regulator [Promethearchaeota archaeon]
MKPLILIVEDNVDILYNLNLILESNNYETITAKNGKKALKILSELAETPAIILSDILMPEMDGYEFFRTISNESRWNRIPFVFLSARTTPEDIRFGKMLGVDDYLTKPFDEKDLLAILSGKISRINRVNALNNKVDEVFSTMNIEMEISHAVDQVDPFICLLLTFWDDQFGPKLDSIYPKEKNFAISLDEIANQLFTVATSIYGYDKISKAEGVLLNIKNLNSRGYLFFDSYPDEDERFGEKQYMLAIIAPLINYFHTLKIRDIFTEISDKIKNNLSWNIKEYWKIIHDILVIKTPQSLN